ncbi:MAG: glycosyltransferase family 2 protein [Lentisphaerae bacterium]|nr:glycosyltransferase family 2 protein [Lentisphaerota bacterium]
MRTKISACITAGNEEPNIRRCLESVAWLDEIVVVDSFSTDRTAEICREYTDLVFRHRWLGYVRQKNLVKDLASHEWVLLIDADEEVSPALREQITREFDGPREPDAAGYRMPRLAFYMGRWIRHGDWYPDVKLRLFRNREAVCAGREPHDTIVVGGPVRDFSAPLFHYSYEDLKAQIDSLNRFSSIGASSWIEDGRRFRRSDLLFRPAWRFFRGYVLRGGFLDGLRGLTIALTSAYAVYMKYAKIWEQTTRREGAGGT